MSHLPEPRFDGPIVLFDGVCSLCDASVHFVLDRDRRGRIRFAPLQSPTGQALLRRFGMDTRTFNSLVLVEGHRISTRSTGALRIATYLDGLWPLLGLFLCVPPAIRDLVYDWVARNRYRWFGQLDACRMPTPQMQSRFLDDAAPPGASS